MVVDPSDLCPETPPTDDDRCRELDPEQTIGGDEPCRCGDPAGVHGFEQDDEEVPTGHYPAYGDGEGGLVYDSEMSISRRVVTWRPCLVEGCSCEDFEAQGMTEQTPAPEPGGLVDLLDAVRAAVEAARKRMPAEWQAITGVIVVDPDGWRGSDALSWEEPITRADFLRRAGESTVRPAPDQIAVEYTAEPYAPAADEHRTPPAPESGAYRVDPPIGVVDLLQIGSCNADDLPEDLEGLQVFRAEWERLSELMRTIKRLVDKEISRHLGPKRAMAWGAPGSRRIFTAKDAREWEWTDPNGVVEELGADLGRCVNGAHVRKTDAVEVIRLRARKRREDPDAAERAFLARYGRYKTKGELSVKPVDKAPKWTQGLEHGEIGDSPR
jgi:hypothetical protein